MVTAHSRIRQRPIIRVFVSSTFSDLKLERDELARRVFPTLERRCLQHGFQFQAIDLRWGVSTEAGLDHRTMRICFEELRRSQEVSPQPNFLILLGNRYGWRPLPEEISQVEFGKLVAAATSGGEEEQPLPGIHGKTAEQVLREWYHLNVLVRTPRETAPDRAPLNYILQPRTQNLSDGRDYTRTKEEPPKDTQDWLDVQQVLWTIINTAFPAESFDHRFDHIDWPQHVAEVHDEQQPKRAIPQIVRFQGSATEQEIWCGALSVPNAEQHVLAFFRDIANPEKFPDPSHLTDLFDLTESGEIDENAQTRQSALKEAIKIRLGENVVELPAAHLIRAKDSSDPVTISTDHIDELCREVESRLTAIINRQIKEYWEPKATYTVGGEPSVDRRTARELEIERDKHLRFGQERGPKETFVGRDEKDGPLERIQDYLNNDSRLPLVIHGDSGCGKTALLARAFQEIPAEKKPIIRFIGVTPRSSDLRSLLQSLCQELRGRHPIAEPRTSDIRELVQEFRKHLNAATAEQPVILFVDALDQLSEAEGGLLLHWLPGSPHDPLPSHVKIVMSCLSDCDDQDPAGQPFAVLQRRKLIDEEEELKALSQADASMLLFDRWSKDAGRTFDGDDPNQRAQRRLIEQRLQSGEQCRRPLYMKLLFEEVKLWRSWDKPSQPGISVEELLEQLVARISLEVNHGSLLVEGALGYLAAARYGLSETEILEALFADDGEHGYKTYLDAQSELTDHTLPSDPPRIPIAIWSRLRSDLSPYLTERAAPGGNVLTLYHRQVAEWFKRHLVDKAKRNPHQRLAAYFVGTVPYVKWSPSDSADLLAITRRHWELATNRSLTELPYLLSCSGSATRLHEILTNLRYIAARCSFRDVYQLIDDLKLYPEPGSFENVRQFMSTHAHRFARFPHSVYSMVSHEGPEELRHDAESMAAEKSWTKPWLRTTRIASLRRESAASPAFELSFQHPLGSCPAGGLAAKRRTAVVVKTIGQLMLIDASTGRTHPLRIDTRATRVCRIVCDSQCESVAVIYDDGVLELFRLAWDALGNCLSAQSILTCKCKLPEFERPEAAFVNERLLFQDADGSLVSINTVSHTTPDVQCLGRAESGSWELSSISGTDNWIIASFRDGNDTRFMTLPSVGQPSGPALRR